MRATGIDAQAGDRGVCDEPFCVAAQNLYGQLRLCVGPVLEEAKRACIGQYGTALARAMDGGDHELVETLYHKNVDLAPEKRIPCGVV
jgi:hypothetical protein